MSEINELAIPIHMNGEVVILTDAISCEPKIANIYFLHGKCAISQRSLTDIGNGLR
jgi:hypothetical protein